MKKTLAFGFLPHAILGFTLRDSITEGVNSTLNGSDTWPDVLSRDAVADFDAATLDPATGAMKAPMQPNDTTGAPGELLHPNRVGYQAMAETIDIKALAPGH